MAGHLDFKSKTFKVLLCLLLKFYFRKKQLLLLQAFIVLLEFPEKISVLCKEVDSTPTG
jgi:hypothetical protein